MAETKQTEIPREMREFAVQSVDQARAAYSQLMDAARKAQDMMKTIIPSNPVAQGLSEVQERAMKFTQQNLDASFSLAHELAKAKDLTEVLQIQSRHAQLQMHAYALQAQELGNLVNAASQKAKPGQLKGFPLNS
jgi:phasin